MGRKRKKNKHLPRYVYVHGKSYRYRPPGSNGERLGPVSDYAGMLRALADLQDQCPQLLTLSDVFNRYQQEVTPLKAEANHKSEGAYLKLLRGLFGDMRPTDFHAHHAATLRDRIGQTKPRKANHIVGLLSHVFTKACEWGAVHQHPIKGMVRKISIKPRRRCPSDAEFAHVRMLASPTIQCVMDIALLTGLRRKDILALERSDVTEEGLISHTSKTDVALLFEWTPALREAVENAQRLPPRVRRHVICNLKGHAYTPRGFGAIWGRLMRRYCNPKQKCWKPGERFQFRDIRRKSATDDADGAAASARLGHTSQEITERVYRVKPKVVRPLR